MDFTQALITYECCITTKYEVSNGWQQKFTVTSFIVLLNRWLSLCSSAATFMIDIGLPLSLTPKVTCLVRRIYSVKNLLNNFLEVRLSSYLTVWVDYGIRQQHTERKSRCHDLAVSDMVFGNLNYIRTACKFSKSSGTDVTDLRLFFLAVFLALRISVLRNQSKRLFFILLLLGTAPAITNLVSTNLLFNALFTLLKRNI